MSPWSASPLLLITFAGLAFLWAILREQGSPNPTYWISGHPFRRSTAPRIFAVVTVVYAILALTLAAGPVVMIFVLRGGRP